MNVIFRPSFQRDLRDVRDQALLQRIQRTLAQVEAAPSVEEVPHLSKLTGYERYYRIRVGGYRLGVAIDGDTVTFLRCLPRDQIYRQFP
jgi:mRNA interferase RelE/StbE